MREERATLETTILTRVVEAQEKERSNAATEKAQLIASKENMLASLQEKASADVSSALSSQLNLLLSHYSIGKEGTFDSVLPLTIQFAALPR